MKHIPFIPAQAVLGSLACLGLVLGLSGCTTLGWRPLGVPDAPVVPPYGVLFTQYSAPLDHDFGTEAGGTATSPDMAKGTSESHFVMIWPITSLLSVGAGDISVEAAAEDGNLSTVHYADYEYLNVLFLYTRTKITAYGE